MKPAKLILLWYLCLSSSICIAAGSKWVGIWESNSIPYKIEHIKGDADGSIKTSFILYSDYYALSTISIHMDILIKEIRAVMDIDINSTGIWEEASKLTVKPEDSTTSTKVEIIFLSDVVDGYRLSDYEKGLLRSQLIGQLKDSFNKELTIEAFLNDAGAINIDNWRKDGMKITRTAVDEPFYYIVPEDNQFQMIDIEDVPELGLVRGILSYSDKDRIDIGLFKRTNPLKPVYAKGVEKDGSSFSLPLDHSLNYSVIAQEKNWINSYIDNNLRPESGNAKFHFSDNSVYDGEWDAGKPSGNGAMTYPNGDKYEGKWLAGVFLAGTADIKLSDNTSYSGDYSKGAPNGLGRKTTKDGSYIGTWNDGVLVKGNAYLNYPLSNITFNCQVIDDKLTGHGLKTTSTGSYDGTWEDGEFIEGTIIKTHTYKYQGTFSDYSFANGKCTLTDGTVFDGEWNMMSLSNGTFSTTVKDDFYPTFVGTVENSILTTGTFTSKAGYTVTSDWNKRLSSDKITIGFENGDSVQGIWDVNTGILVEGSLLKYIWNDGISCTYLVGKKLKLTKPTYSDAEGIVSKPKIAKGRVLITTDGEGFTIPPVSLQAVKKVLETIIALP